MGDELTQRHMKGDRGSSTASRCDMEPCADRLRALVHALSPVAATDGRSVEADPIVTHREHERDASMLEADDDAAGVGMLAYVVEGFLEDAQDLDRDARGDRLAILDVAVDADAETIREFLRLSLNQ